MLDQGDVDGRRGGFLEAGEDVAVGIELDRHAGMAEPFRDDLRVHARAEHQAARQLAMGDGATFHAILDAVQGRT